MVRIDPSIINFLKRSGTIAVLCMLLLNAACSIEKRRHLSGWNVQWKGKVGKTHKVLKVKTEDETFVLSDTADNTSSQNSQSPNTPSANTDYALASADDELFLPFIITRDTTKKKVGKEQSYVPENSEQVEEKKLDRLGLTAFIVFIIGLFTIAPLPVALFLGAFSMRANRKNPNKYKGKWLGQVAFWVPFVLIAAAVPLFLLAAIFAGAEMLVVAGIALIVALIAFIIAHPKSK